MTPKNEIAVKEQTATPATRTFAREEDFVPPLADIYETPDAFVLMLDMPGASRDTMSVRLDKGTLFVKASVEKYHQENATILHSETLAPGYYRTFSIGEGIDIESVDAQFEHGVLTVKLLKSERIKPREISIR